MFSLLLGKHLFSEFIQKKVYESFGGLQKSRTFALAKRKQPPGILEARLFALKERVL